MKESETLKFFTKKKISRLEARAERWFADDIEIIDFFSRTYPPLCFFFVERDMRLQR